MSPTNPPSPPSSFAPTSSSPPIPTAPSLPYFAAHVVYSIPELLENIMQFLARPDLLQCARVDGAFFAAAVKELYHTVDFYELQRLKAIPPIRQETYRAAVRRIRSAHHYDDPHTSYPRAFTEGDIVSQLRHDFPALRYIEALSHPLYESQDGYEHRKGIEGWAVRFQAGHPPGGTTCSADRARDRGHIIRYTPQRLDLPALNCPSPNASPPTSGDFTFEERHSCHFLDKRRLTGDDPGASMPAPPAFSKLGLELVIQGIVLPLSHLTTLYDQQIAAGYIPSERLRYITVMEPEAWSVGDFRSFARIASSSLTHLRLVHDRDPWDGLRRGLQIRSSVDAGDLGEIVAIVRDLPNLLAFDFDLHGMEYAEAVCAKLLTGTSLDNSGTITQLRIYGSCDPHESYNIVRCLYGMCARKAEIQIGECDGRYASPEGRCSTRFVAADQQDILRYLERLSPAHRRALATIDIPSLGITKPGDLYQFLRFGEDGRPIPTWRTKAAAWEASAATGAALGPTLTSSLLDIEVGAKRIQDGTMVHWTEAAKLEEAEKMLEAFQRVKEIITKLDRTFRQGYMERELELQVRLARRRAKGERELAGEDS